VAILTLQLAYRNLPEALKNHTLGHLEHVHLHRFFLQSIRDMDTVDTRENRPITEREAGTETYDVASRTILRNSILI
jgi:hypothetical protein